MPNKKIITRANNILSINCDELSSLSKIYLISIVKLTLDLLNDELIENNDELTTLINTIEILHTKFEKYYDWNGDFYFNDYDTIIKKSFLTYISEKNNKYYSVDDIKVKCFVLEDFIEMYKCSKFKKINEKNKLIELSEIKLIYNNWKKILNFI